MEKTTKCKWEELPQDILLEISKKIKTRVDTLRVRAVCKNFLAYVPPPKSLFPHSVLKIPLPNGPSPEKIAEYELTESTFYAIKPREEISIPPGQAKTWILKVQEIDSGDHEKTCRVRLMDPTYPLIVFENMSVQLPKNFNLLDYQVIELAKAFDLRLDVLYVYDGVEIRDSVIYFVSDEFDVMAYYKDKLAVLRHGESTWTVLENLDIASVQNITYYKMNFYAVDRKGYTIAVDCKSLNVKKMETPRLVLDTGCKYLVQSDKNLYLVVEYWRCKLPYKKKPSCFPVDFDVFKLDEKRNKWVALLDGFDDTVFFLGGYSSFALSADEIPGIKRNCVYISDSDTSYVEDPRHPGSISMVYNINEDKTTPLSSHDSDYSQVFWPPPAWLK